MKYFLSLLSILVVSEVSFAAESANPTVSAPAPSSRSASLTRGFRFALLKSFLTTKVDYKYSSNRDGDSYDRAYTLESKIDDTSGFSIGYSYIPYMSLGFLGGVSMFEMKSEGPSNQLVRGDLNLTFAPTEFMYLKTGVNMAKSTKFYQEMNPGFGFQVALGFQISRNFGADFGYTEMHQSGSEKELGEGESMEIKNSGFETAIHATF